MLGMAEEDPNATHGLRLTINDYPFANDGILMWDALKQWVSTYVSHYYPNASLVESDEELQEWWTEIQTVASVHHTAVNFGQYAYAGYFPNKPTVARTQMPTEDPSEEEWKLFLKNPGAVLFQCFPSRMQATKVMAVLDVLSNHSPDEEYSREEMEPS
ncbi:hypothetical protein CRYUN_Cryun11dG0072600 [Craigia yunnanensis]